MAKRQPMRLRDIRVLRGYRTQRAFAEAVGVTQETVSLWERGVKMPLLDIAVRAARLLGLTVEEFYAYIELERVRRQTKEVQSA